jgi:hypothetical protein
MDRTRSPDLLKFAVAVYVAVIPFVSGIITSAFVFLVRVSAVNRTPLVAD